MTTERELGWDDEIANDGQDFILLPEGEYPFTVVKLERGRFDGSTKMPACNQANLTLRVDGGDKGFSDVLESLKLHQRTEWVLCAFFRSIGARKHGEKLRPNWGQVVGRSGRCIIEVNEYTGKDGKTRQNNRVKKFLDPVETSSASADETGWDNQF